MTCFVMVMAMYPEKQALAKAELDQLLRGKRLPTIADRGSLPYIEAMIHETLRWHVALPASEFSPLNVRKFSISNAKFAGLPRRTAKADEYRGYHIPEGTIILPNVWCADPILFPVTMPQLKMPNRSIAREGYDDSEEFRPERFLDGQEPGYVFGFGRRYASIPSDCVLGSFSRRLPKTLPR